MNKKPSSAAPTEAVRNASLRLIVPITSPHTAKAIEEDAKGSKSSNSNAAFDQEEKKQEDYRHRRNKGTRAGERGSL